MVPSSLEDFSPVGTAVRTSSPRTVVVETTSLAVYRLLFEISQYMYSMYAGFDILKNFDVTLSDFRIDPWANDRVTWTGWSEVCSK